jgi:hypothetical protein
LPTLTKAKATRIGSDNNGGQTLAFSRGVALLVRADDATAANDMLDIEGLDSSKKRTVEPE